MKSVEWKTYRTRFLIKAKQLNAALSFVDHLGREHSGRKGDYLVESCEGVLSIAPRQIFEDIYVPIRRGEGGEVAPARVGSERTAAGLRFPPVGVEQIKPAGSVRAGERGRTEDRAPRAPRKSPQSVRSAPPRISLM
jgi:hypothetical protein